MRGIIPDGQSDVYQYELTKMDKKAMAKRHYKIKSELK